MSEAEFGNRTVLVTGGSRGIGRACCQRLANAGARVAINYHARQDDARETARLVESAGGQAMIVQANVADAPIEVRIPSASPQLSRTKSWTQSAASPKPRPPRGEHEPSRSACAPPRETSPPPEAGRKRGHSTFQ